MSQTSIEGNWYRNKYNIAKPVTALTTTTLKSSLP